MNIVKQEIHTTQYLLTIPFHYQEDQIVFWFYSKMKNQPPATFLGIAPNELIEEDRQKRLRDMYRYRSIYFKPSIPSIIYHHHQNPHSILFRNIMKFDKYSSKLTEKNDKKINKGIKYWQGKTQVAEIKVTLDPYNNQVNINILNKVNEIKVGQAAISITRQPQNQHPPTDLFPLFNSITNSSTWFIDWHKKLFINNDPPLPEIPLTSSLILPSLPSPQLSPKESVFRHIFLTELIAHMIINRFGRQKWKKNREREGYQQVQYQDEELEELRSWGYRMNEFRDIPIKRQKKRKNDDDSLVEEEEVEEKKGRDYKGIRQQHKKEEKSKTKLGRMGLKIKKRRQEDLCNFTFISGEEKSKINKMRYCLHQMVRETDKTQALMDFIRLVFNVEPIEMLLSNSLKEDQEGKSLNAKTMRAFLKQFKVKRDIEKCIKQYTQQGFLHKILNIGLRVLHEPYQLVYLRLPFSHLFWSIKFLYHRHKRAIFHHKAEKNTSRAIILYRGCSLSEKQLLNLKDCTNEYIQAEGFLSTSLKSKIACRFEVNVKMEIIVPVPNLKSLFDNGFAHISNFSSMSSEEEVLLNAFNVFKILMVSSPKKGEKSYQVVLEYGSIKSVEEEALKKSDDLIEEEVKWQLDQQQISWARTKLEINQEYMTNKEYKKLMTLLPTEEQKLKKRKKRLDQWREREYQTAVDKLSKWDKELIINTQHQKSHITYLQNYGKLLLQLGQYRRACVYTRRRVKQVQLDRAVEGVEWRKSQCLILKEQEFRQILSLSYSYIGRSGESWEQMEKLFNLYVSINLPKTQPKYYGLLSNMYTICNEKLDNELETKIYRDRLMNILTQNQLKHTHIYKLMREEIERDNEIKKVNKQKEEKEMIQMKKMKKAEKKKIKREHRQMKAKRKQRLKQMKQELQHIRLQTYGLYTYQYLQLLCKIIQMLYIWRNWKSVLKQGSRYMKIRNHAPHVEHRTYTCWVLMMMLEACVNGNHKKQIKEVCVGVAEFTHTTVHNHKEFQLVLQSISSCLTLQRERAGKLPLLKLMQAKIKCQLTKDHMEAILIDGYVLLLLSVSEYKLVYTFLSWIGTLYQQHSPTRSQKRVFKHILSYNEEYKNSQHEMYDERKKDYNDANIIKHMKKRLIEWQEFPFEEKKIQLMPWQHPLYPLYPNIAYVVVGIRMLMARGEILLLRSFFQQELHLFYNVIDQKMLKPYLRRVNTFTKLHLSPQQLQQIPLLLRFYSNMCFVIKQQSKLRIDIEAVIRETQHIDQDQKAKIRNQIRKQIRQCEQVIFSSSKQLKQELEIVKMMRMIANRNLKSILPSKDKWTDINFGQKSLFRIQPKASIVERCFFQHDPPKDNNYNKIKFQMGESFQQFLTFPNLGLDQKTQSLGQDQKTQSKLTRRRRWLNSANFFIQISEEDTIAFLQKSVFGGSWDSSQIPFIQRKISTFSQLHISNNRLWAFGKIESKLLEKYSDQPGVELPEMLSRLILRKKEVPLFTDYENQTSISQQINKINSKK